MKNLIKTTHLLNHNASVLKKIYKKQKSSIE